MINEQIHRLNKSISKDNDNNNVIFSKFSSRTIENGNCHESPQTIFVFAWAKNASKSWCWCSLKLVLSYEFLQMAWTYRTSLIPPCIYVILNLEVLFFDITQWYVMCFVFVSNVINDPNFVLQRKEDGILFKSVNL